ncbi:hypothetical protein ACG2OD_00395 [Streptomyces sp. PDY-4]|uniref:hypothetical protein n=1 Tax=Streptomyces sp. PDY-4 TaxID=3376070 RepID=UPI00379E4421
MTSQEEERLLAEAKELEDRVPPLAAGPRTEHERLMLERAAELRRRADDYVPGSSGPLRQRLVEVIENEVPETYARLASARVNETFDAWSEEAVVRARDTARKLFAGLMPGATGTAMADEIADKILAAVWTKDA